MASTPSWFNRCTGVMWLRFGRVILTSPACAPIAHPIVKLIMAAITQRFQDILKALSLKLLHRNVVKMPGGAHCLSPFWPFFQERDYLSPLNQHPNAASLNTQMGVTLGGSFLSAVS